MSSVPDNDFVTTMHYSDILKLALLNFFEFDDRSGGTDILDARNANNRQRVCQLAFRIYSGHLDNPEWTMYPVRVDQDRFAQCAPFFPAEFAADSFERMWIPIKNEIYIDYCKHVIRQEMLSQHQSLVCCLRTLSTRLRTVSTENSDEVKGLVTNAARCACMLTEHRLTLKFIVLRSMPIFYALVDMIVDALCVHLCKAETMSEKHVES